MVILSAGQMVMGSPADEIGRDDDESPQWRVAVAAFAIAETEVTRAQWQTFERASGHRATSGCLSRRDDGYTNEAHLGWRYPGFTQTDEHPVVCVNWDDAQAYSHWLSSKTGHRYRLPTEREWEYAARAGTQTPYPWTEGVEQLCAYANLADEALRRHQPRLPAQSCNDSHPHTAPVGSFTPNAWGLYDMHGNVMEWVQDCWSPRLNSDAVYKAPLNCRSRVTRGGGWDLTGRYLRSAYRGKAPQANQGTATGFRLLRVLP
jgi:formylglycine-generating enzyme required for sulfatase activity